MQAADSLSVPDDLPDAIDGEAGFWVGPLLSEAELTRIREMIQDMFLSRVKAFAPSAITHFANLNLAHYHHHADMLDHAAAWSRHARLFPSPAIAFIESSSLLQRLSTVLGKAAITNEVENGAPEIVWRLVRPGQPDDVGPLHADGWFWDINRWPVPPGRRRVKIWTMVHGEAGNAGLRVVPGSHRAAPWPHGMEHRHGLDKPIFDEAALGEKKPLLLNTQPGTSVVFHDDLLHGGAVTGGDQCRVSFEFTLFVPRKHKDI